MCGNACRCIGKYVYERGLTDKTDIRLLTPSGIKMLRLNLDIRTGCVESVTVDMGTPVFLNSRQYIPTGDTPAGTFVSMGNPHYVIFVNDVEDVDVATEGNLRAFSGAGQCGICHCTGQADDPDARVGARQRHHNGLWHRSLRYGCCCGADPPGRTPMQGHHGRRLTRHRMAPDRQPYPHERSRRLRLRRRTDY